MPLTHVRTAGARTVGAAAAATALATITLVACSSPGTPSPSDSFSTVSVTATDTTCLINPTTLAAGQVKFAVTNSGGQVTEVYVYGQNGAAFTSVVSEVENVGPGTSREMTATLSAGRYEVACKPGQTGAGIRAALTVSGPSGSAPTASASQTPSSAAREIELSTDGTTITGLANQSAQLNEAVEFKFTNKANGPRNLEIKRPDGSVAGEVEVAKGKVGELPVNLGAIGQWQVIVEGGKTVLDSKLTVKG